MWKADPELKFHGWAEAIEKLLDNEKCGISIGLIIFNFEIVV